MRKHLFLVFFLLLFSISSVHAETQQEEAKKVCDSYIQNRTAFKNLETEKCGCQFGTQAECNCFKIPAGVKEERRFVSINTGGTCFSSGIGLLEDKGSTHWMEFTNGENGYGMGSGIRLVQFGNRIYALMSGLSNSISRLNEYDMTVLCEIGFQIDGWKKAEPRNSPICNKLSKRKYKELSPPDGTYEESWPPLSIDLDNDGLPETVTHSANISTGGCGCDSYQWGITAGRKRDAASTASDRSNGLVSTESTQCGTHIILSVIDIDGRKYILEETSTQHYQNKQDTRRRLLSWHNGAISSVCEQEPILSDGAAIQEK